MKPLYREHWSMLPIPLLVAGWAVLAFWVLEPGTFGLETRVILFGRFALAAFLLGGACSVFVRWVGCNSFLRARCPKCQSPMRERFERTIRFECTGCGWDFDTGEDYSDRNMPGGLE